MLKRILSILIATTLLCSLLVIDVSAEYLLREDFSSGDLSMFTSLVNPEGTAWKREIRDGALHLYNPENGPMSQTLLLGAPIEQEAVLRFDFKMDSSTGYLITNIYKGGERGRYTASIEPAGIYAGSMHSAVHTPGTWYTYIFHMKADELDIYRKVKDSSDSFKLIVAGIARTNNTSPAQFQPYCAKGIDATIDNIKMFEGTFAENARFELNDTSIESLGGLTSGTLKAKATVSTTKAATEVVGGETFLAGTNVLPMLVVYNSNHKMIYSTVVTGTQIMAGENNIEVSVDTSSFANKVAGGYIGFYVWDGLNLLQPIMDAIELR